MKWWFSSWNLFLFSLSKVCRISSADCFISGFTASQSPQLRLRSIVGYTLPELFSFCFPFVFKVASALWRSDCHSVCLRLMMIFIFVHTRKSKDRYRKKTQKKPLNVLHRLITCIIKLSVYLTLRTSELAFENKKSVQISSARIGCSFFARIISEIWNCSYNTKICITIKPTLQPFILRLKCLSQSYSFSRATLWYTTVILRYDLSPQIFRNNGISPASKKPSIFIYQLKQYRKHMFIVRNILPYLFRFVKSKMSTLRDILLFLYYN